MLVHAIVAAGSAVIAAVITAHMLRPAITRDNTEISSGGTTEQEKTETTPPRPQSSTVVVRYPPGANASPESPRRSVVELEIPGVTAGVSIDPTGTPSVSTSEDSSSIPTTLPPAPTV